MERVTFVMLFYVFFVSPTNYEYITNLRIYKFVKHANRR
jgi:hypothetical protein